MAMKKPKLVKAMPKKKAILQAGFAPMKPPKPKAKPKRKPKAKPKMMKKVPKGNMTLPKLSERKKKRIEKRVGRKAKAASRKVLKTIKKSSQRNKLAKGLLEKYGRKDYDRIRKDASFVASLPAADRAKVKTINALKKSEVRKTKAVKRKSKKINKLKAN